MEITLIALAVLAVVSILLGVLYIVRRRHVPRAPKGSGGTVPLDRNPEMPHRPNATS